MNKLWEDRAGMSFGGGAGGAGAGAEGEAAAEVEPEVSYQEKCVLTLIANCI